METTQERQLVKNLASRNCSILIGAGVSKASANLPLWDDFIRRISKETLDSEAKNLEIDFDQVDRNGSKLVFLDFLKTRHTARYYRAITDTLSTDGTRARSPIYDSIIKINPRLILTTNLDTLIEDAYQESGVDSHVVTSEKNIAAITHNKTTIVKFHGCISNTDNNYILTQQEYEDFEKFRALNAFVISSIAQSPLLILGSGLYDPNFKRFLHLVSSALGSFTNDIYYVGPKPSKWEEDYLTQQYPIRFIQIDHVNEKNALSNWLKKLSSLVDHEVTRKINERSRVNEFLKLKSYHSLGTHLQSYSELQSSYNELIHIPDYERFQTNWENTLYANIKREFSKSISNLSPQGLKLTYFAPGPHAPLINGEQGQFNRIDFFDIDPTILEQIEAYNPNLEESGFFECDITAGQGQHLCDLLNAAIEDVNDLHKIKSNTEDVLNSIDNLEISHAEYISKVYRSKLRPKESDSDVAISEMVATFSMTPVFMGFRSKLFEKFPYNSGHTENTENNLLVEEILNVVTIIWQKYNKILVELHLNHLTTLVKPGGIVMLVTDIEKNITEEGKNETISSLPPGTALTILYPENTSQVDTKNWPWQDHNMTFDLKINGWSVSDFYKHEHTISFCTAAKKNT